MLPRSTDKYMQNELKIDADELVHSTISPWAVITFDVILIFISIILFEV